MTGRRGRGGREGGNGRGLKEERSGAGAGEGIEGGRGSGEADGETLNYSEEGENPPSPPPQHHRHVPGGGFERGRLASPANGPQIDTPHAPRAPGGGARGGSYRLSLSRPTRMCK